MLASSAIQEGVQMLARSGLEPVQLGTPLFHTRSFRDYRIEALNYKWRRVIIKESGSYHLGKIGGKAEVQVTTGTASINGTRCKCSSPSEWPLTLEEGVAVIIEAEAGTIITFRDLESAVRPKPMV